ncbi:hypothetical protein Q4F19_13540 [Sphingomonas sp. BIUV-7]|uniref:Uncharacterized protein n=1 Tax=Sphingomonas natans TaxID=3063330 RepID=A0ABT8YCQ9_9SPHN|nr:hypothetical protein [Sphingomonas sp. BIUV-7]MDO6415410.1 hypothetical protein [Sphingomonas sp. BIUV-7]
MNGEDKVASAAAQTDHFATGKVALAGVAALCNELQASGLIDQYALGRIRAFLLISIEKSVGTVNLRGHLTREVARHFEDMGLRLD